MYILAWYFDNVIATNRGVSKGYFFFLKGWTKKDGPRSRSNSRLGHSLEGFHFNRISTGKELEMCENDDETVVEETNSTIDEMGNYTDFEGILCEGVSKHYKKYPYCKSKQDHKALTSVYLRVEKGELLSILGPNGAGKFIYNSRKNNLD